MKIEYDNGGRRFTDNTGESIYTSKMIITPHNLIAGSMGYRSLGVDSERMFVDKDILDEHFDPVDNINFVEFLSKKGKFITYKQCYKHKTVDYFILVDPDIRQEEAIDYDYEYVEGQYKLSNVYYNSENDDTCREMVKSLNDLFTESIETEHVIYLVLKTQFGYKLKRERIKPENINFPLMYNDDFDEVHKNIVDKLINTKKGIVLLDGTAGTGKTNYIMNLTRLIPDKKFIYIPSNLIPSLIDPSFVSLLMENKGSVLVLEDCETYLKDRVEAGNEVVSSLLNLSDGIMGKALEIQIIATFNAGIDQIDKALLRQGRLINEYKFTALSEEKTRRLGNEYKIKGLSGEMTLAEIFNQDSGTTKSQKERRQIGFGK